MPDPFSEEEKADFVEAPQPTGQENFSIATQKDKFLGGGGHPEAKQHTAPPEIMGYLNDRLTVAEQKYKRYNERKAEGHNPVVRRSRADTGARFISSVLRRRASAPCPIRSAR